MFEFLKKNYEHVLEVRINWHCIKQENYFGIYHPQTKKWYDTSFALRCTAEEMAEQLLLSWENEEPLPGYSSVIEQDLVCVFLERFSDTIVSLRTKINKGEI